MRLTAISLFTGGMGLDLGFERAGFVIKAVVEKDKRAVETIHGNRPDVPVFWDDLKEVTTEEILVAAGLAVGEATVVLGAPPCEPFSTAGKRNGFHDGRADAVKEFIKVIREAQPHFFVMEEVPGFLHAAKKHISFYERVKMDSAKLEEELRLGSAFEEIMQEFQGLGYALSFDPKEPKRCVLNAADYGVPQKRKRFILIGTREEVAVPLPKATHASPSSPEVAQGKKKAWRTLRDALAGLDQSQQEVLEFSPIWKKYLQHVQPGGCWRDLPPDLQKQALGGAYDDPDNTLTKGLKGGRTGFLRRLAWDQPAPTLVDRPTTKACCMGHPDDWQRTLSVQEYARLQGFPDSWVFSGDVSTRYRLIGQATPVGLAEAVARTIKLALAELSA